MLVEANICHIPRPFYFNSEMHKLGSTLWTVLMNRDDLGDAM